MMNTVATALKIIMRTVINNKISAIVLSRIDSGERFTEQFVLSDLFEKKLKLP